MRKLLKQVGILKILDSVMKETCRGMKSSLSFHYPVSGGNDIPEALTVLYLAHALRDKDYLLYPVHQIKRHPQEHFDLAAIHVAQKVICLLEAKRLYNSGQAARMGWDWKRMQTIELAGWGKIPKKLKSYSCLLATTWDPTISSWWCSAKKESAPHRRKVKAWNDLREALIQAKYCKSFKVYQFPDWSPYNTLYLLIAVTQFQAGIWTDNVPKDHEKDS